MGATQRPTTTVDIARAIGLLDDAFGCTTANPDPKPEDLRFVRAVICGLTDQVKEAVQMATDHLTPRIYWRDGERWIEDPDGYQARMTERFPNLERLWIQTHQDEADAAYAFSRKFPGRKVRF